LHISSSPSDAADLSPVSNEQINNCSSSSNQDGNEANRTVSMKEWDEMQREIRNVR
jgi:hypothetical protein